MENIISISDLADAIAREKNVPQSVAKDFVSLFFSIIEESLIEEKLVKVKGLGTFKLIDVAERESIDVNSGERILIKGHPKVTFTPDTSLRDRVNRPFAAFETITLNDGTNADEMGRVPEKSNSDDISDTSTISEPELSSFQETVSSQVAENPNSTMSVHQPQTEVPIEVETIVEDQELESKKDDTIVEIESSKESLIEPSSDTLQDASVDSETPETVSETTLPSDSIQSNDAKKDDELEDIPAPLITTSNTTISDEDLKSSKQSNKWKYLLRACLVLFLMLISYFAGYYKLLCPNCDFFNTGNKENTCKNADSKNKSQIADTIQTKPKKNAPKPRPEDQFAQVPGGKFLIVGTKGTRIMKVGDTLLKMAQEEYGDKEYAKYIIVHNNFPNPDVIPLGYEVKLPELK